MKFLNKEIVFFSYDRNKQDKKKIKEEKKKEKRRLDYERAEINKFYNKWIEVMAYMGLKNEMFNTFALRNIKYQPYGFSANIHAPLGMTLMELQTEKSINTIQDDLCCVFIFNKIPKSNHMEAKFIIRDSGFVNYLPIEIKPYEILISQNIDGTPMISNMLKYPHALIQGGTNMGKTKFMDIILTNLIATCSPKDLNIYIVQADKNDQYIYSGCQHCKGYTEDIVSTMLMLQNILEIIEKRNSELKGYNYDGICVNIKEYNDSVKKGIIKGKKTWSYNYLVIDEYATLMPEGDYGDSKKIKQVIQSLMERIIQIGRSVGFYCILSTQRSTIDKLPSFVKSNCMTIVTFKVGNRKSSEIAIDSGEAVNLKQREFITKIETMNFGQTYNLTQKDIVEFIKPYRSSKPPNFEYKIDEEVLDDIKGKKGKKNKRKTSAERKKAKKKAEEMNKMAGEKEMEELSEYKEQIEEKSELKKEDKNEVVNEEEVFNAKEKNDKIKFEL